jgi:hypothetical protein
MAEFDPSNIDPGGIDIMVLRGPALADIMAALKSAWPWRRDP